MTKVRAKQWSAVFEWCNCKRRRCYHASKRGSWALNHNEAGLMKIIPLIFLPRGSFLGWTPWFTCIHLGCRRGTPFYCGAGTLALDCNTREIRWPGQRARLWSLFSSSCRNHRGRWRLSKRWRGDCRLRKWLLLVCPSENLLGKCWWSLKRSQCIFWNCHAGRQQGKGQLDEGLSTACSRNFPAISRIRFPIQFRRNE